MSQEELFLARGCGLDALRAKIGRPPFDAIFQRMVNDVHVTAAKDLQTDKISSHGWCHSQYFTPHVLEAGFLYAITGDSVAASHVARQIDKLARFYADPPASMYREIGPFRGPATAYFSNAHTCLAARMCEAGLPAASLRQLSDLARQWLIDDHGKPDYFFTHFNAAHNAVVTHAISAAICALTFGEATAHPRAEQIIEWGRDACEMHLRCGFDENGAPYEGPMYALVTLEWVFLFADLLRRHGREDLFQALPEIRTVVQAQTEMQLPGMRGFFAYNDCRQLVQSYPMRWLLLTAAAYGRPQDLALWYETRPGSEWDSDGARRGGYALPPGTRASDKDGLFEILWWDGSIPVRRVTDFSPPLYHVGRGAGVATLRTSWRPDATCVNVLAQGRSHNVPDHTHADAGHFSIIVNDELLAYEPSYFNFDEDTHSVVLVDDKPPHPTRSGNLFHGTFEDVQHVSFMDYLRIDASAAKNCLWAYRHVLFVRGPKDLSYVVILDNINVDNAIHNFKWQLQANLHTRIRVAANRATVEGRQAALDCVFFSPLPEDYPTAPHRLRVFADEHPHTNLWTGKPGTNPRLVAEQTGPNCTLLSVVVPRRLDSPPAVVTARPAVRTFDIRVRCGEPEDQIVWGCDHNWIRRPDLKAGSEVVFVRRDGRGQVAQSWTSDGRPIRFAQG